MLESSEFEDGGQIFSISICFFVFFCFISTWACTWYQFLRPRGWSIYPGLHFLIFGVGWPHRDSYQKGVLLQCDFGMGQKNYLINVSACSLELHKGVIGIILFTTNLWFTPHASMRHGFKWQFWALSSKMGTISGPHSYTQYSPNFSD